MARLQAFFNVIEAANRRDIRQRRLLARHNNLLMDVQNLSEEEFRRNYRITKDLLEVLVADLTPYMKRPTRRSDIAIKCKILIALSFYATGSYQRIIGRISGTTVSQPSVSKAIRDVTKALNSREILLKYIKFPNLFEERNVIKRKFYEKYQIPNCIGCIDGTQIALIRPKINEERYFNRKYFHSLNVQIICDSEMNILNVDAAFGGATHDSFIFNQHPVKDFLMSLQSRETSFLLGDSGYPLREYLLTPILNAATGSPDEYYTNKHCSTRNVVERTIGLLKSRWRCLLKHRVLHYDPHTAAEIVNACCVLHNLCNWSNVPLLENTREEVIMQDVAVPAEPPPLSQFNDELRRGQEARQRLVQSIWVARRH